MNSSHNWQGAEALKRIQKELKSLKKTEEAMTREAIENDLQDAILAGDSKEAWRLSRMRASFKLGPRNKYMSRLRVSTPSLEEWADFLAKPGPQGGCSAYPLELDDVADAEDEQIQPIMTHHYTEANNYITKMRKKLMEMKLHKWVQPDDFPVDILRLMVDAPTKKAARTGLSWTPFEGPRELIQGMPPAY